MGGFDVDILNVVEISTFDSVHIILGEGTCTVDQNIKSSFWIVVSVWFVSFLATLHLVSVIIEFDQVILDVSDQILQIKKTKLLLSIMKETYLQCCIIWQISSDHMHLPYESTLHSSQLLSSWSIVDIVVFIITALSGVDLGDSLEHNHDDVGPLVQVVVRQLYAQLSGCTCDANPLVMEVRQ